MKCECCYYYDSNVTYSDPELVMRSTELRYIKIGYRRKIYYE